MKYIYFIAILFLMTSCGSRTDSRDNSRSNSENENLTEEQILHNEDLKSVSLAYFDTINIEGTSTVIIPVGASKSKTKRSKDYSLNLAHPTMKFNYYEDWYKDNYNRFFNLIFFDVEKDSSYLLFNQERAIINEVLPNVNKSGEAASKFIFYKIRDKDYNLDGKLNYKDGDHLFVSNKDGSNLIQLTPNNSQLLNWTIIKESNIIIAEVLVDTNDNKKFNRYKGDKTQLIKIDLNLVKKGKPFLSKETENQLKEQFLDLVIKSK